LKTQPKMNQTKNISNNLNTSCCKFPINDFLQLIGIYVVLQNGIEVINLAQRYGLF